MASDLLTLMRKLAPDLTDEMARRALILERIAVMQPGPVSSDSGAGDSEHGGIAEGTGLCGTECVRHDADE